jgi:hypothetical protein
MPDSGEPTMPSDHDASKSKLADVVRLSLVQAADLQELSDRAKDIAERISKLTPPPESPASSE